MLNNPLFERTVTALMAGEVICEYRYEDLYTYLLQESNQQRVRDFLEQINRVVRQTGSRDAWVCAYYDLNSPDAKEGVRQQFREVANHLEALVQFLRLVMSVETSDRPVSPGEKLTEGRLIEQISGVPSLEERLRSLTEKRLFATKKQDVPGRIRSIMETLVAKGYLVRFGSSGAEYQATGKWSWLYDVMDFIQAHEGIPVESGDDDNQLRLT
jgi:hypothetical protein